MFISFYICLIVLCFQNQVNVALSVLGVIGNCAMSLVVPLYWFNGADKFDVNPVLMILNHSWTWIWILFELVFLSGLKLKMTHFFVFLPFHYPYALILLPILQKQGKDPSLFGENYLNFQSSPLAKARNK